MSIKSDMTTLEARLGAVNDDQRKAIGSLIQSIISIVGDKEIENGIPSDVKTLAGDIVLEAMTLYGLMGAEKVKKAFNEALAQCPMLREMIPTGSF